MPDTAPIVRMGQVVPDVEMTVYDPVTDDFATFAIKEQIAKQRWTVLFFYPGDFTFV